MKLEFGKIVINSLVGNKIDYLRAPFSKVTQKHFSSLDAISHANLKSDGND